MVTQCWGWELGDAAADTSVMARPRAGRGGGWATLPHGVLFVPAAPWHCKAASRSARSSSATASGRTSMGTPRCGTTVSGPTALRARSAAGDGTAPGEGVK